MKRQLTRRHARAVNAFRRAPFYDPLKELLTQILAEQRNEYETTEPANEELRVVLQDGKTLFNLLYNDTIEHIEGTD